MKIPDVAKQVGAVVGSVAGIAVISLAAITFTSGGEPSPSTIKLVLGLLAAEALIGSLYFVASHMNDGR